MGCPIRSLCAGLTLVTLSLAVAARLPQDTCSGNQAVGHQGTWTLLCSGTCSVDDCKRSGSSVISCKCGDQTNACCNLMLTDLDGDGKKEPNALGACPPCGTQGSCEVIITEGNPCDTAQPACIPQGQ